MELQFIPISHYNPRHRVPVVAWIEELKKGHELEPMFIASEWASNQFLHIALRQRPRFGKQLADHWPRARPQDVATLVESIGFEGDCWLDQFPSVPVIWLDDESRDDPSEYAARTLLDWDGFLTSYPPKGDWSNLIDCIGQGADALDQRTKANRRHERDVKFTARIIERIGLPAEDYRAGSRHTGNGPEPWAMVVVGKNHAYADAGTMRWMLDEAGHHCYEMPGQL